MDYETLKIDRDGPSFVVTLNRPSRRNAISLQCMDEILDACRQAEAEPDSRAVILTGGPDYFSAGADLNEARATQGAVVTVDYLNAWHRLNAGLENLKKPVLAAIEGFCMTGGWELALACDIRVGAEGSTYAMTSSKIGSVPGAGGTQRLPRVVGIPKALEIMFSGDVIDAQEAYRIGALNRLTPKGGALDEAKKMVKVYENRAPTSLHFLKRVVHTGMQMDLTSAIQFETFLETAIFTTEDRLEGFSAFLEKRSPKFKGR